MSLAWTFLRPYDLAILGVRPGDRCNLSVAPTDLRGLFILHELTVVAFFIMVARGERERGGWA